MANKYKKVNRLLLKYIKKEKLVDFLFKDQTLKGVFFSIMEHHIDKCPHDKFGKILIEHFCEDFKNGKENPGDKAILDVLYKDIENPIDESPSYTLQRLQGVLKS